jgi:endonuclease YncB( thermonuclease family)
LPDAVAVQAIRWDECVRKLIVPALLTLALIIGANSGREDTELSGDDEAAAPVPAATAAESATADPRPTDPDLTVTDIVDGDTVDLSDGRRVRVLGIDTPEKGECGFEEASEFARATLLNKEVDVASDPTQDAVDQYGRSLLYVSRWGVDYSLVVIGAGWARHYTVEGNPVQKAKTLQHAEHMAKALKIGIWGDSCAALPSPAPAPVKNRQVPAQNDNDDDVFRPAPAPAPQPAPAPRPEPAPGPAPAPKADPAPASELNCHPSYQPCVADGPDLDCPQIGHQVSVVGPDEYRLDADNDGTGCDSY